MDLSSQGSIFLNLFILYWLKYHICLFFPPPSEGGILSNFPLLFILSRQIKMDENDVVV